MSETDKGPAFPTYCAVVVSYHPGPEVGETLRLVVEQCGLALVVDNGSSAEDLARLASVLGVQVMPLGRNFGIATALNRGVSRAAELGFSHAILFDQDSRPERGFAAALVATAVAHPRAAVVVPRIVELGAAPRLYRWARRHPSLPFGFQRVACEGVDLPDVTMAITSGSLVEIAAWRALGGADETLFIDYVDTDHCLRVARSGRTIAVSAGAILLHRLGDRREQRFVGFTLRPTNHAPVRHYFMARNRVHLWRRHAVARPDWAAFDLSYLVYNTVRVLLSEEARWLKLKALTLGTWDGLIGRRGPCPPNRERALKG